MSVTPGMMDAGSVRISARLADGLVDDVRIASRRPDVTAVLRGKPADQAVALVPMIFGLCGRAQGHAAVLALAAARGIETAPHLDSAIESEVLREHLWRLLLDLPPLLGMAPPRELFGAARAAVSTGDRDALKSVLGDGFWNRLLGALGEIEEPEPGVTAMLPLLSAAGSHAAWAALDRAFAVAPEWEGEPAETGAFARWGGQNPGAAGPFAARWHARAAEVWSWAAGDAKLGAGGTASAAPHPQRAGCGRALVETARGLLMHEITLDGDRIADYVIVAPTEWNFHPRGTLFDWLHKRPAVNPGRLHAFAGHAVAALDPCVRWELEIE